MSISIRIVHINDVYELDNFASFYSLVQKNSDGVDKLLVLLPGDFLGPSLLSSLDKGHGMVDIMNRVGVTHVCFGNHECDVPIEALQKRLKEQSKFLWVNTNMQSINKIIGAETPSYDIVTVSNSEGETRSICLLGLLTDDQGLYRPGSFGGAKIEPVISSTERCLNTLEDHEIDLILPMTHQSMAEDRLFAEHFGSQFPLVLGGHDHNPFDEVVNGSRILKTGCDAINTNIIDIRWESVHSAKPTISVNMVQTKTFKPDVDVQNQIQGHWQIIKELELAKLFCVHKWSDGKEFTTKNNRLGPTTGSTALVTMLRMGLQAQCCILNAGSIRGSATYASNTFFTWSDLKAEIPFPTNMVVVPVPGSVIEATIRHSRQLSRKVPPSASGGYLHTCSNILYNDKTETIDSIDGALMLPNQLYLTAMNIQFLQGIDNLVPLLEWAETNKIHCDIECAIPAKLILVELFSALLWLQLGSFEDLDANGDGMLQREEVKESVFKHYGDWTVADLVVDNVFSIADIDGDGTISPLEMMVVHLVATDLVSPDTLGDDDEQLLEAMKETAAHVLGEADTESEKVIKMVARIQQHLYLSKDGVLKRRDHEKTLGKLRRRSYLI